MSDWLWRYRGLVIVILAAGCVIGLLQLAEHAPDSSTAPTDNRQPQHSPDADGNPLSGRVSNDVGSPVRGATVCAHCDAPDCPMELLGAPRCTTSDGRGLWRISPLPATLFWLTAGAPEHTPSTWARGSGGDRLDLRRPLSALEFVLSRGGAELTGAVVDAYGAPIAGALIGRVVDREQAIVAAPAVTDESGRFTTWLGGGVTALEVYAPSFATKTVSVAAPADIRVTLHPDAKVRGRVVDTEGQPIAGARVGVGDDAFGAWRRHVAKVLTTAEGTFEIRGLAPGRYAAYAATANAYGEGELLVVGPMQSAQTEIVLHPAETVTGTIRVDGRPCTNGYVRLTKESDSTVVQRVLDPDGRAHLAPLLPGHYQALAHCVGAAPTGGPQAIDVGDGVSDLSWTTTRGLTLRGVVVSEGGRPLGDIRVVADAESGESGSATTHADGTFAVSGLPPGPTRIRAEVLGVPLSGEQRVALAGDSVPIRVLALAPGGLELRVVDDESGEALAGFEVSIEGEHKVVTNTADDGRVEFPRLAPGEYQVIAGHPVGGRELRANWVLGGAQQQVTVTSGETTNMAIRIAGLVGVLEGWVMDADGNPIADAVVTPRYREPIGEAQDHVLMFTGHHNWRATTNEAGAFSLTRLIPGHYDLCATHYSGAIGCIEEVVTREQATIVLEETGALAGTVNRGSTAPVDLTLSAHELTRGIERAQRFLFQGGHWTLDRLPAGTWQLVAESSLGTGEVTVELTAAGARSDIAIAIEPRVDVTGRVVTFAEDTGLSGVEVSIWPETGSAVGVRRAVTDAVGAFSITGVPVGRAELRVQEPEGYVDFFGRAVEVPAGGGDLGATRLVRTPGAERGMYGFRPTWPPVGDTIAELQLRIEDIKPDSPAGMAGLGIGDSVVAINGVSVAGTNHYLFWGLIAATPGTIKTITLADGHELSMTAANFDWP